MTRDEAIEKVDGLEPFDIPTRREQNALLVDKLVALGMLKLDEPKGPPLERLMTAMGTPTHPSHIPAMLDALGLKIVEK